MTTRRSVLAAGLLGSSSAFTAAATATDTGISTATVRLASGQHFPLASFGLQAYDDDRARKATLLALEVGYRNFFASSLAGNARGFARAVCESRIPRSELFICGSVAVSPSRSVRASLGYEAAYASTVRGWDATMAAMVSGGVDRLDMVLLDYPCRACDGVRGQWDALQALAPPATSLAVSNFSVDELDCLLRSPGLKRAPVLNQLPLGVAYHPGHPRVLEQNRERGLLVQAWAPLGGSLGGAAQRALPTVRAVCSEVGARYGKSGAQVALRWVTQSGAAFTTTSRKRSHLEEDLNGVFDFELSDGDMARLSSLTSV